LYLPYNNFGQNKQGYMQCYRAQWLMIELEKSHPVTAP
jgi:hypothetical protein